MLAVITLFAMLMVEDADADQAVNHTGNTQLPDAYSGRIEQGYDMAIQGIIRKT